MSLTKTNKIWGNVSVSAPRKATITGTETRTNYISGSAEVTYQEGEKAVSITPQGVKIDVVKEEKPKVTAQPQTARDILTTWRTKGLREAYTQTQPIRSEVDKQFVGTPIMFERPFKAEAMTTGVQRIPTSQETITREPDINKRMIGSIFYDLNKPKNQSFISEFKPSWKERLKIKKEDFLSKQTTSKSDLVKIGVGTLDTTLSTGKVIGSVALSPILFPIALARNPEGTTTAVLTTLSLPFTKSGREKIMQSGYKYGKEFKGLRKGKALGQFLGTMGSLYLFQPTGKFKVNEKISLLEAGAGTKYQAKAWITTKNIIKNKKVSFGFQQPKVTGLSVFKAQTTRIFGQDKAVDVTRFSGKLNLNKVRTRFKGVEIATFKPSKTIISKTTPIISTEAKGVLFVQPSRKVAGIVKPSTLTRKVAGIVKPSTLTRVSPSLISQRFSIYKYRRVGLTTIISDTKQAGVSFTISRRGLDFSKTRTSKLFSSGERQVLMSGTKTKRLVDKSFQPFLDSKGFSAKTLEISSGDKGIQKWTSQSQMFDFKPEIKPLTETGVIPRTKPLPKAKPLSGLQNLVKDAKTNRLIRQVETATKGKPTLLLGTKTSTKTFKDLISKKEPLQTGEITSIVSKTIKKPVVKAPVVSALAIKTMSAVDVLSALSSKKATSQKQIQSLSQSQFNILKPKSTAKIKQISPLKNVFPVQNIKKIVGQKQIQAQVPALKITTTSTPTPPTPVPPVVIIPPPPITEWGMPSFGFPFGGSKKSFSFNRPKQRYAPTVQAIIMGIKGKASKKQQATGLTIRGL